MAPFSIFFLQHLSRIYNSILQHSHQKYIAHCQGQSSVFLHTETNRTATSSHDARTDNPDSQGPHEQDHGSSVRAVPSAAERCAPQLERQRQEIRQELRQWHHNGTTDKKIRQEIHNGTTDKKSESKGDSDIRASAVGSQESTSPIASPIGTSESRTIPTDIDINNQCSDTSGSIDIGEQDSDPTDRA